MATPTSSRTSRRTASSIVSPGSTNPAMHEYIGTGNATPPRQERLLAPRHERDHGRGDAREGEEPARRAPHGPLAGRRLGRGAAAAAEAVGAGPVDQLHGPAGDRPLHLGQAAVEGAQIAEQHVVGHAARWRRARWPSTPSSKASPRRRACRSPAAAPRPPTPRSPERETTSSRRWRACRAAGGGGRRRRSRACTVEARPYLTCRDDQRRDRRSRADTVGRRGGGLASVHPADLLATVQKAVIERSGIDPAEIGQVVGAASARSASRASTSPARRGCRPACRCRSRPPPSTRSAARASRPRTSPPRWSARAWSTWPSRAASR